MNRNLRSAIADALDLDGSIESSESVSGGSINRAALVDAEVGTFFVKWNDGSAPDDLFLREAESLSELAAAGTSIEIPEPLAARRPRDGCPGFLVLDYIEPGTRAPDFDERLGRGLAQVHQEGAEAFGFPHDNYCGEIPQPNDWTDDWLEFYREQRLGHQIELAAETRGLSSDARRVFDRLLTSLDGLLVGGSPSLVHGDLWHGNLHTTPEGDPALIDPAAYYGHPEAEVGMMELFGGFSDAVYDAYREVRELPAGWRDRVPLYSLYHVLNHYNLFGGHWGDRAIEIARRHAG